MDVSVVDRGMENCLKGGVDTVDSDDCMNIAQNVPAASVLEHTRLFVSLHIDEQPREKILDFEACVLRSIRKGTIPPTQIHKSFRGLIFLMHHLQQKWAHSQ